MKNDEEREVPDPRESIEEIPTVQSPLVSSKSLQSTDPKQYWSLKPKGGGAWFSRICWICLWFV